MAKEIVTYEKKVLPSGRSDEVKRPFQPASPMMPIGAASQKWGAISRLGKAGADMGFTLMKINADLEQHRQNVVAENEGNNFAEMQIDKQRAWEQRYPGSLATEETLQERYDELNGDAAEIIERRTDLNDTTKQALGKLLNHYVTNYRLNSSNYNQAQVNVVENDNIRADLARQILDVEQGVKTTEQAIELHALSFKNNNGREDLFYFNTIQIEKAAAAASKQRTITKELIDLTERYLETPGYKSDYGEGLDGAINEVESSGFLKEHGAEKQKAVLASLVRAQTQFEKEQKMFSDKWKQENVPKLRQVTLTYEDIEKSPLTGDEKIQWNGMLEVQMRDLAAGKDDPLTVVDPAVDNEIMQEIYSQSPPAREEITALVGKGLSINRAEHWINVLAKPDRGYKRALDYLKSQIAPSMGLFVGAKTAESAAYWKSVMDLDEQMELAAGKEKPLMGNEILKEAMRIAPMYIMSVPESIAASTERFKPKKILGKAEALVIYKEAGEDKAEARKLAIERGYTITRY